jgi:hypothetical protein
MFSPEDSVTRTAVIPRQLAGIAADAFAVVEDGGCCWLGLRVRAWRSCTRRKPSGLYPTGEGDDVNDCDEDDNVVLEPWDRIWFAACLVTRKSPVQIYSKSVVSKVRARDLVRVLQRGRGRVNKHYSGGRYACAESIEYANITHYNIQCTELVNYSLLTGVLIDSSSVVSTLCANSVCPWC